MIVDLEKNPKQFDYFCEAWKAVKGLTEKRDFLYGGAIRGGKTFISSTILLSFAKFYPNTRWHIFRANFPSLEKTTIPTFSKIIQGNTDWGWSRNAGNYFVYNRKSESRIFFTGENLSHDPNLDSLLGLETNGIMFEQIEELSEKLWNVAHSRNGSWYVDKMPTPLTLSTFNPSQSWIKEKFHIPFLKGELPKHFHYQIALPSDNAFVTGDQYENWQRMDERYIRQFIEGDWTNFDSTGSRWAYAYDSNKHLGIFDLDPNKPVCLSFDFNKNPMCCSVFQHNDFNQLRIYETIKIPNSDIYQMCEYIKVNYGNKLFIVTGDASGNNLSAMVKDNLNYYRIIQSELNLSRNQLIVPSVNPSIDENRVLFNSILSRGDFMAHKEKTKALQFDLDNAQVLPDGTLKKMDRNDPTQQLDALDTARYAANTFLHNFILQ